MTKKSANVYSTLGASNHASGERAQYDLYCTHPDAVTELLKLETFSRDIWEPCDGLGHISDTLVANGYNVRKSDLLTRGRDIEQLDILACNEPWHGAIVTNPPYSHALPIIRKCLELVDDGCKVAMWLRILFLESKARKELFKQYPPPTDMGIVKANTLLRQRGKLPRKRTRLRVVHLGERLQRSNDYRLVLR